MPKQAWLLAGIPAKNPSLYRQIRFLVGDPVAWIGFDHLETDGSLLIVRDIEMHRAEQHTRAGKIFCPANFPPAGGLSADRETATAQAAAVALLEQDVQVVVADRTLPLLFSHVLTAAGITVQCDPDLGVAERRQKDEQEVAWLQAAQTATESAIRMACELIARADTDDDGLLIHEGEILTAERTRTFIDMHLLNLGYENPGSIVACASQAADCHELGSGPLKSGESVVVDVFPRNKQTLYNGDCTRTVVHGKPSAEIEKIHAAVVAAKAAAIAEVWPGNSGNNVHAATRETLESHGYQIVRPGAPTNPPVRMPHGTGHGVGLDVHEPPLLDDGGPELLLGDCVTVEPGVYGSSVGGVRVEDMVVVTAEGSRNLNQLHEGLDWK
jgi:Xaa-Pro aminopeptidase